MSGLITPSAYHAQIGTHSVPSFELPISAGTQKGQTDVMLGALHDEYLQVLEAHLGDMRMLDDGTGVQGQKDCGICSGKVSHVDPSLRTFLIACNDAAVLPSRTTYIFSDPSSSLGQEFLGLLTNKCSISL